MYIISFLAASVLGFVLCEIISNPNKKLHQKLPSIKIKWFQLIPNVKVHTKRKEFHFHHWMYLSVLLVITIIYNTGWLDTVVAKGAIFGGIAQGLTFPDWKQVVKQKA